jgi:cation diffusion facilitator CzcD-associated flavoprotein CzcO
MTSAAAPEEIDVLVVGAGFAGMYAIYRGRDAGLSVVGIEAGDDVGGTWYWNRYPGARCDVESFDYSYSFDEALQNEWVWSERYATQPEILRYAQHVADRFDLRKHYRFEERVSFAHYDESSATWLVGTNSGLRFRAQFVIFATGSLSAPIKPDIPGVDDFAGEVLFTAQWPKEGVDLAGKRVGMIGTGSSGIQSTPIIAEQAGSLTIFQRSANYSVPAFNHQHDEAAQRKIREEYAERRKKCLYSSSAGPYEAYPKSFYEIDDEERAAALEARWRAGGVLFGKTFDDQYSDPVINGAARDFAINKVRSIVQDPQTAEDLIPNDHPIGTKRICTDSNYFETFNRDNVKLVNLRREPITSITNWGIKTTTASYEIDTLIFATGFDAMTGALTRIDIRGVDGADIKEIWGDGPITFLGMGIPGFPNMFSVTGPGSPSVLANMILAAEQQVEWLFDLIGYLRTNGIASIEAKQDAAEAWTEHVDAVAQGTLFVKANSWYMGANIEGKRRLFMPYIGGFGNYRHRCDDEAAAGYPNFIQKSLVPA